MEKKEDLIKKYRLGTCSEEERAWVESWHLEELKQYESSLSTEELEAINQRLFENIQSKKYPFNHSKQKHYLKYAALFILALPLIYFFIFHYNRNKIEPNYQKVVTEIKPKENNALLELADGRIVSLNKNYKGNIAAEGPINAVQSEKGLLEYDINEKNLTASNASYNKISTPKGGTYAVLLTDGTKVWLNASSSLKFPLVFSTNERVIEISGEAYIEVASVANKPFFVKSGDQTIQVLGTKFNVEAYPEDRFIKTTLLQGKVKIKNKFQQTLLKPGEQTIADKEQPTELIKKQVDIEEAIAWKNDVFMFSNEPIESIMKKIARWYDVEVVYNGNIKGKRFAGDISRMSNVEDVLKIMELTGTIQFKVEGRRIIVTPK